MREEGECGEKAAFELRQPISEIHILKCRHLFIQLGLIITFHLGNEGNLFYESFVIALAAEESKVNGIIAFPILGQLICQYFLNSIKIYLVESHLISAKSRSC